MLNNIFNKPEKKISRYFTLCIQCLIVLSLIASSIETLPNLSTSARKSLSLIEIVIIIIFTIEYFLRIIYSSRKIQYIFSFYGLIDLFAIIPFYLSTAIDLRAIRVFRLFRLIRILKLFKYSKAINRFHRALNIAKEELILFALVTIILLYLSAVGIYYFENAAQPQLFQSVFHSLWWAVTTLTTVGYGDMFPVTSGGKIFTTIILFIGLGIVAIPTGLIASALSIARQEENEDKAPK